MDAGGCPRDDAVCQLASFAASEVDGPPACTGHVANILVRPDDGSDRPGGRKGHGVITRSVGGDKLTLTVLLLGGGPEIRAKTRRIFHRRSIDYVLDEVGAWLTAEIGSLGCTPAVAAVGIGRSQVEASTLMLEAMAEGNLDNQNDFEKKITAAINASKVGPLGLGGDVTALGTFLKIGPTRASGVRIVSARPCCCVEPRRATIALDG